MKNEDFLSSFQTAKNAAGKEKAFELSLRVLVKGMDNRQNKFREKTQLLSISAKEATFWLRSRVAVGSRLDLELEIPKTLILENHLRLQVSGTVIRAQEEPNRTAKKRLVCIGLDKKFKLLPKASTIN